MEHFKILVGHGDYITNNGTLNIKSGRIYNTSNPWASNTAVIYNAGTVNMSGGTILKRGDGDGYCIENINNAYITGGTIDSSNHGIYNNSSGELVIDGGIVKGLNDGNGIDVNSGKVTVNDGEVSGANNGVDLSDGTSIEVNGGKISGTDYGIYGYEANIKVNEGEINNSSYGIYASSSSTVEMNGGNINNSTYGVYERESTVEVNGGTINATNTGIYAIETSTVNVNGGTVQGNTYGIRYDIDTEVVVGDSSETLDNDSSKVIGRTYGVYSNEYRRSFEFNNGVIIGNTNITYNGVATCRRGNYAPQTNYNSSNSNYVTSLTSISSSYNYAIETKGYTTLAQAASDAISGDTITVLKTVTDNSSSDINIADNVILNLNNYTTTLSRPINVNNSATFRIRGEGTLRGNSSEHTIVNNGTLYAESDRDSVLSNTYSNYAVIDNNGTATANILEGTINGRTYGIYNENGGNLISTNTTITATNYGVYNVSNAVANVEGGTITANYGVHNQSGGDITLTEVPITATNYGVYNNSDATINIEGGTITASYGIYNNNSSGSFNLTGKLLIDSTSYGIYNNASDIYLNINLTSSTDPYNIESGNTGIYLGNGTLDFKRGYIGYDSTGINVESGEVNLTGGYVRYRDDNSRDSTRGIYNRDATINMSSGYVYGAYGIYNSGSGIINISNSAFIHGSWYAYGDRGVRAGIYNTSNGTINMTDGTIEAYGYGIYNSSSSGTINITGGEVRGERNYAIYNSGTMSLGDNSIAYDANSLEIESHNSYGVYSSRNYNFYNGTIRGSSSTPYSTGTIQIRDGYKAGSVVQVDSTFGMTGTDGYEPPEKVYEMTLVPE